MTTAALQKSSYEFNVEKYRADFPTLHQQISGCTLSYLDNGASTQKPQSVIDSIANYYANDNANVHRGIHTLSQRATDLFEAARVTVRKFVNANSNSEIIFTSGTTSAINLVAQTFARQFKAGDEIIISEMEHDSNIVPWSALAIVGRTNWCCSQSYSHQSKR